MAEVNAAMCCCITETVSWIQQDRASVVWHERDGRPVHPCCHASVSSIPCRQQHDPKSTAGAMLSYSCDSIARQGRQPNCLSSSCHTRSKQGDTANVPLQRNQDLSVADLCRPHWTRTIFLDACWQRALGMPLVMTSRMLLQLAAVPD